MSIVKREGVKGGRPIIEGTKLTVPHVHELVHEQDVSPEEIVEIYYGVDVEAVHEALDYYESHPDEMARFEKERQEAVNNLRMDSVPIFKWAMLEQSVRDRPGMYLTPENEPNNIPEWVSDESREELRRLAVERCPGRSL